MELSRSKKVILVILVLATVYAFYGNIREFYHFYRYTTYGVARLNSIKSQNVSDFAIYEFIVDGKHITGSTYIEGEVRTFWINKYFKVKYSSKNPEINEILLDKMITDVSAVKAAGFKLVHKKGDTIREH